MRVTPSMLRHQGALALRSVHRIAREPQVGRELPRLLATRGRGTVDLRLPWLPFRLIDELTERVGPGSRVFEYGGGGSTLWFLDRGAEVVTVEHDPAWAGTLRTMAESDRWTFLQRPDSDHFESYVAAITAFPDEHFDVVVVDGRERARCVGAARDKVRAGGLLIVDDADRARYAPAIAATGWRRRDVVGFAPAKPTLAYTAVLEKPDIAP